MNPLANHLWQSTLFAAAVALLSLALRGNRARTRYWLWLAASLKFLVPFSLLMTLGSGLAWRPVAAAVSQVGDVFMPLPPIAAADGSVLAGVAALLWFIGFARTLLTWGQSWRAMKEARRAAIPAGIAAPIPVLSTAAPIEPGVFGIFRPVLLLPKGITEWLTAEQMQAIIAHELCHVRRRDNLAALGHMLVEAIFWFHPLVRWIGARMVAERERACDEEVVRLGNRPEAYAEGILHVCQFYLQSSLPCASGVTGADLKERIQSIMSARAVSGLTLGRKALLALALLAALMTPMLVGIVQAQGQLTFDVASIRPANPKEQNRRINIVPGGGLNIVNIPVRELIEFAYSMRQAQIVDSPGWTGTTAYDIVARLEKPEGKTDFDQMNEGERDTLQMQLKKRTQALLEDRFQLKVRREAREMPILALTVAKGGLKMQRVAEGDERPRNMFMRRGSMSAQKAPMAMLANALSRHLSQSVVDQTGLQGDFDISMNWSPDAAPDAEGPSIYTALQEQLGLRLESKKGAMEVIVIERVERPSEN
jgi:uncharacterized protein (TIGR03435 family)